MRRKDTIKKIMEWLSKALSWIVMEDIIVGKKTLNIRGNDKGNYQLLIGEDWLFKFNNKDLEKWKELSWIQIYPEKKLPMQL